VALALLAGCGGGKSASTTGTTAALAADTTTTAANGDSSSTTAAPGVAAGASTTAVAGATPTTKAGTPTTKAAAPTTTLKPTAPAADVSKAKAYLLTQDDVGAGYEKDDSGSTGPSDDDLDIEKCGKGNPVFAKNNPNDIQGDHFTKGKNTFESATAGSGATIASSTAEATQAMEIAKTDEFLRCVEEQARQAMAKRAPPGSTSDIKASRRPLTGGDDATDVHITATFTYQTTKITADIDIFAYRKGGTLVFADVTILGATNAGEPARISEIMKKKIG
jgi:hypothetical protein